MAEDEHHGVRLKAGPVVAGTIELRAEEVSALRRQAAVCGLSVERWAERLMAAEAEQFQHTLGDPGPWATDGDVVIGTVELPPETAMAVLRARADGGQALGLELSYQAERLRLLTTPVLAMAAESCWYWDPGYLALHLVALARLLEDLPAGMREELEAQARNELASRPAQSEPTDEQLELLAEAQRRPAQRQRTRARA